MYNILVCDDDKEIVEAIDIYLSQEGYHILKAYDGEQAVKLLESSEEEIHLLLLDVMMPKLDGIRATLKIRENHSIPIIILSAKSEDVDKILGLNVGADADITIFDPARVKDRATFPEPTLPPEGIEYVFLGGEPALEHGKLLRDDLGKPVRV